MDPYNEKFSLDRLDEKIFEGQTKFSVRKKIIGISAILIIVLVFITAFSSFRLVYIKHEIVDIAEFNIPAANLISLARQHSLEQELHLQRIFKNFAFSDPSLEQIEKEIKKFEYYDKKVDKEFIRLEKLLEDGVQRAEIESDKFFYKALFEDVKVVDREHQEFVEHASEIIGALVDGEEEKANKLREKLDSEIKTFNSHISKILRKLELKTQKSILLAEQHEEEVLTLSSTITAAALVIGLTYGIFISTGFVQPIRRLSNEVARIIKGNIDVQVNVSGSDEIGQLGKTFQYMASELAQKRQIEETFGKYVDPRIVKVITDDDGIAKTDGERRQMTVMFAGISNLQSLISEADPYKLARFYNEYLEILSAPISANQGIIDKFIGTDAMGFWGAPFTEEDEHSELALASAEKIVAELPQIQTLLMRALNPDLKMDKNLTTIGIASGEVVVGNMGSASSMSYTVMGEIVNVASRLKGAGMQYNVPVLCSENTKKFAGAEHLFREIDQIYAVGMDQPLRIFELITAARKQAGFDQETVDLYGAGLSMYRVGDWGKAEEIWRCLIRKNPDDITTRTMLARLPKLQKMEPQEWTGIWRLDDK